MSNDPEHKARPQSKPMIADTNNISLDDPEVPDIDHFDPDLSSVGSDRERIQDFSSPMRL